MTTRARTIEMTDEKSPMWHYTTHRGVEASANGNVPTRCVLEDDVFMTYGFARNLEATWSSLLHPGTAEPDFDLLPLAFAEVGNASRVHNGDGARRLQQPGIWEASTYVLVAKAREATRCASSLGRSTSG